MYIWKSCFILTTWLWISSRFDWSPSPQWELSALTSTRYVPRNTVSISASKGSALFLASLAIDPRKFPLSEATVSQIFDDLLTIQSFWFKDVLQRGRNVHDKPVPGLPRRDNQHKARRPIDLASSERVWIIDRFASISSMYFDHLVNNKLLAISFVIVVHSVSYFVVTTVFPFLSFLSWFSGGVMAISWAVMLLGELSGGLTRSTCEISSFGGKLGGRRGISKESWASHGLSPIGFLTGSKMSFSFSVSIFKGVSRSIYFRHF